MDQKTLWFEKDEVHSELRLPEEVLHIWAFQKIQGSVE